MKTTTEAKTEKLIEKLKKIALDNYEKGGDGMVECWGDAEWLDFVSRNSKRPVTALREQMKRLASMRRDIEGASW